jgi:hypothetical protein
VKIIEDYQYTRFTFFYIENFGYLYAPEESELSSIKNTIILGSSGVLFGDYDGNEFDSADAIRSTFEDIEKLEYASIDLGHIWVPNFAIKYPKSKSLTKGHVYRITDILFKRSFQFNLDRITLEELNEGYREVENGIRYSKSETMAFIDWRRQQIDVSRQKYRSNVKRTKMLTQKNTK